MIGYIYASKDYSGFYYDKDTYEIFSYSGNKSLNKQKEIMKFNKQGAQISSGMLLTLFLIAATRNFRFSGLAAIIITLGIVYSLLVGLYYGIYIGKLFEKFMTVDDTLCRTGVLFDNKNMREVLNRNILQKQLKHYVIYYGFCFLIFILSCILYNLSWFGPTIFFINVVPMILITLGLKIIYTPYKIKIIFNEKNYK